MSPYQIFVLQYAHRECNSSEVFLGDLHQSPMEMAYYIWAIKNDEHTVVVDMGFTDPVAARRKRKILWQPGAQLEKVGVDPAQVRHVIVTHMHYDHVGHHALFPKATFYLQDDEIRFWTGRYATYPSFRGALEPDDVVALVHYNFLGRVRFVKPREEILPGITIHRVGGHTAGMQIVEVKTASGTAVLASDASHMYRNLEQNLPFPLLHNIPEMIDAYELIRGLASRPELILPGHDPDVLNRHKRLQEGIAIVQ